MFESRHLLRVFGRAGKAGSDKNLASKIRNVCGICLIFITESGSLSTLICRKCEELVSKASEIRQRRQIMQRNWNKGIQWRVVFWSNCRHRVNRLLSSGKSLQLKLILVLSGVDCLYDFYVSYFCCFLLGHSTFLSLHSCLERALHAVF